MIRALVDLALKSRWLVLGAVVLVTGWGILAFRGLPIEAYPDVANNYVTVITQWPGRSAEEIERQVTVPVEIQMAGIPHLTHLRSSTLAGISSLMLIFDDDSIGNVNREHVLERLNQVTLPAGLVPQMGTDWSPVGQIYWYTLESTNPSYDVMEKKSLEDWTLEKQFKSVKGVVDVASFGGPTKEYQIKLDPDKLIQYGLSISQVEQQIANNNSNGGGSFIEQGAQGINVQSLGLFTTVQDIQNTVVKTINGAAIRIKDIATVEQGPKIRLGQIGRATHRDDGTIVDNPDTVEGIVLLQKGSDSDPVLQGIHEKVDELNEHILPKGEDSSLPRSLQAGFVHGRDGRTQSARRRAAGFDHPLPISRQRARRHHRHTHYPICIAVRFDLPRPEPYSCESAFVGRTGLWHGCRWFGRDDRKHGAASLEA